MASDVELSRWRCVCACLIPRRDVIHDPFEKFSARFLKVYNRLELVVIVYISVRNIRDKAKRGLGKCCKIFGQRKKLLLIVNRVDISFTYRSDFAFPGVTLHFSKSQLENRTLLKLRTV